MTYTRVSSSNIAAVGYESSTSTLGVQFLNGSEYHYNNVPSHHHSGLLNASSVGSYFDEHIKKGGYSYRKVR